jgi:hypothetical protein
VLSACTGVTGSTDGEESSVHWICCRAAASCRRLLLSRAYKFSTSVYLHGNVTQSF